MLFDKRLFGAVKKGAKVQRYDLSELDNSRAVVQELVDTSTRQDYISHGLVAPGVSDKVTRATGM